MDAQDNLNLRILHMIYFERNKYTFIFLLIELGFNDTSTPVGHFVSSPREREKIDKRDSRGDEREGQGGKENELK